MYKMTAITAVGPAACGKTTFSRFLGELLSMGSARHDTVVKDVSEIIRWGQKQNTFTQAQKDKILTLSRKGLLVPDKIINRLVLMWVDHTRKEMPDIRYFVLGGLPRTIRQLCALQDFDRTVVLHINADLEQTKTAVKKRMADSRPEEVRTDDRDGDKVTDTRWLEYVRHTLPVVQALNGSVIQLKRSEPLRDRLITTIHDLAHIPNPPVSKWRASHAMAILDDPNHPITRQIAVID